MLRFSYKIPEVKPILLISKKNLLSSQLMGLMQFQLNLYGARLPDPNQRFGFIKPSIF
jgi:hypothetical protein